MLCEQAGISTADVDLAGNHSAQRLHPGPDNRIRYGIWQYADRCFHQPDDRWKRILWQRVSGQDL